jgi:1-acyl-sn-glycerol-3-phosphate acyltransferase
MLGLPLGRQHRPLVAWYGGADLLPHLRRVLSEGGIDVHVVFGPARRFGARDDRKAVAQEAGAFVRRLVTMMNAGRTPAEISGEAAGVSPGGS